MRVDNLLVVGSPDTTKAMEAELSRLSRRALSRVPARPRRAGSGTLVYPFDPALARVALRYHRTLTRIYAELYRLRARRLEPLYDELVAALAADDRPWLEGAGSISVRARNVAAFAAGERQIVGAVKNAIVNAAGGRGITLEVEPKTPDLLVTARMHDDELSISIDLGAGSLSQHGYRRRAGVAPLREHLAAAMIMIARWDARRELLVDPMCGSGTIAIEAALMAQARPRSAEEPRSPLVAGAEIPDGSLFGDTQPAVWASDADSGVIVAARDNARAAGVAELVRPEARDLFSIDPDELIELAPDGRGLVLCNPPYGERLPEPDLIGLYRRLGGWCARLRGFRVALLVGPGPFERAFGLEPRVVKPLANGPIRAHMYVYEP